MVIPLNMNDSQQHAVEQAIAYMKEHLDEEITSEQLADLVGYSPYHFTRLFKRVTGISPRQYLSALRIESSKHELLHTKSPSLLNNVLPATGFQSIGSFHTRFKQFVGLSPKKFQNEANSLTSHMDEWEHKKLALSSSTDTPPVIRCEIVTPPSFRGIIFAGLFPRPIPDQRPIVGTAINQNSRCCIFTRIPSGTYYVLVAGIAWSLNPRDYFLLNHSLRGIYENTITVTEATDLNISITLREPLPQDPPIVINLPQLLFEQNKRNKAK